MLPGPVSNGGLAVGAQAQIRRDAAGAATIHDAGGNQLHAVPANWTATLESYAYHQSRTRINEGLGMHLPGAGQPAARNRAAGANLDDNTFDTVANRYEGDAGDVHRGYQNTLGPARTRLNVQDPQLGWDVSVAPYRRLGGDTIFNEAHHQNPAPYQNQLQPAHAVDVNNPAWYYDQANAMPNRFVGGRSNSTALYMSSATMLFHSGRLSLDDAADVLAFVIADMVVSGEHSMPECMTTVVMAAGNSEPWTQTPINLAGPAQTLAAWLILVPAGIRQALKNDARGAIVRLLNTPAPDLKLVKTLTMLIRAIP